MPEKSRRPEELEAVFGTSEERDSDGGTFVLEPIRPSAEGLILLPQQKTGEYPSELKGTRHNSAGSPTENIESGEWQTLSQHASGPPSVPRQEMGILLSRADGYCN